MHTVIYKHSGITVTREMNQKQLAELLMDENVELVSVNAPKISGRRKRKSHK